MMEGQAEGRQILWSAGMSWQGLASGAVVDTVSRKQSGWKTAAGRARAVHGAISLGLPPSLITPTSPVLSEQGSNLPEH